ncbi:TATA box-binding protein-associated factor, RNA polymerase I, subunit C isoform X1 [Gouania willdenowi]|uniref:TATA box-binding protein-associated factor RNA polymerase I subunit C n=1 Tax=Gouania willdenowi TaxID=441366 RepID=A0A8C5HPI7_GOUWI|nr:TATA box-binding protein-associated factor RNA polymerase I subunit C isoform X1 [Gouania willdenowi]
MDYQFPQQLFPSLYTSGPSDAVLEHVAGKWGSYERVRPQGVSGPSSSWTFTAKHHTSGEKWRLVEPVPIPFLSPKKAFQWPITPPDPLDFTDHLNNYYLDHSQDAFGCMTDILGGNFNFHQKKREKDGEHSVNMWRVKKFLNMLKFQTCPLTYSSNTLASYSQLLSDVVPSISPELLGSHLYDELAEQRDRLLFCEVATGGALAFIPFSQSSSSQQGCLLYPGSLGLDLNFHKIELQHHSESSSLLNQSSEEPFNVQLKGSVRQLSCSSLFNDCCVGVRSDYFCGVWRFNEINDPRLLQVVNTTDVASCISVSPHILGEVLVASESGVADLWTVGKGMQRIRTENSNLYFNAKSSWRWCEFTAHPRVMLYADRTGADLTDIRVNPTSNHTLFKISSSAECRPGERLVLCKYLENVHPYHHIITTQYSAYIMDERFPYVPMLKLDHMMDAPPVYCHIVPSSVNETAGVSKVLLGSHRSQEITLLQYSGGQAETCFSLGPPRALLRPKDSLHHLPAQIPHRMDTATKRLSSPATGLTFMQTPSGETGKRCICVLQLTEAGDIFYQILEPEQQEANTSQPPSAEDILQTQLQPTQTEASLTPEKDQLQRLHAVNSSEESDAEYKLEMLSHLQSQVAITNEPMPEDHDKDENVPPQQSTPMKVSNRALVIWKHWLQKLFRKSRQNKPHSHVPQHFTVKTDGLLCQSESGSRGPSQKVETLRQTLRTCMSQRSLLLHSTVSDLLQIPHVPIPYQVDTKARADLLSQRLTHAWQGQEVWNAWWDEHLGQNKEAKVRALRRKRRREKVARRAAGQPYELSGSFSSSASCISETDDFSVSQTPWSDIEDPGSHLSTMDENPEVTTPSSIPFDSPYSTPTATSRSVRGEQQTVQRGRTLSLIPNPESTAVRQRSDSPADRLHTTQEESLQRNRSSTMTHSFQTSISKRSQGQRASSQASQPKKKSRMGF